MTAFQILLPAFIASLILTGIHAYLGVHVVERGVIFVDLSLAQIAALGLTVAYLAGYDIHTSHQAYLFSLGFTFIGAAIFAFTRTHRKTRIPQEAIIGIVYAVSAAVAILLMSKATQETEHLKEMLVGNILAVSWYEIAKTAVMYSLVGLFHFVFRRRFLLISMDEPEAERQGVNIRFWDFLFYMSFGFVVTSSVAIAGVLLVFCFLIVPSVAAMLFSEPLGDRLDDGRGRLGRGRRAVFRAGPSDRRHDRRDLRSGAASGRHLPCALLSWRRHSVIREARETAAPVLPNIVGRGMTAYSLRRLFVTCLDPGDMDCHVDDQRPEHRQQARDQLGMAMLGLRKQVAGADEEEEAAEQRQHQAKLCLVQRKEEGRDNAEGRGHRIDQQPPERLPALPRVLEDHAHGVDAVREVVRQDRHRHHYAHRRGRLESQSDPHAVEEAVDGKTARPQPGRCALGGGVILERVGVEQDDAVEQHVQQETRRDNRGDRGRAVTFRAELQGLGQQIEEGHADHGAGTEAEDEVQLVVPLQGEQPAQQGREDSGKA
jgi:zinc/manganese transport system permease protein